MTIRDLTADEYTALRDYAHEHGRNWKAKLQEDWYNARARGDRGAILHGLRNDPNWNYRGLEAFNVEWPNILSVVPAHVSTVATKADTGDIKWSGRVPVPAVGADCPKVNGSVDGTVLGYVVEGGWLGLWVRDASGDTGTLFGAEL